MYQCFLAHQHLIHLAYNALEWLVVRFDFKDADLRQICLRDPTSPKSDSFRTAIAFWQP